VDRSIRQLLVSFRVPFLNNHGLVVKRKQGDVDLPNVLGVVAPGLVFLHTALPINSGPFSFDGMGDRLADFNDFQNIARPGAHLGLRVLGVYHR